MTIWRVAMAIAFTRSSEVRWRQVAVPFACATAAFLLCATLAVPLMIEREHERLAARTASTGAAAKESDLLLLERDDSIAGHQYPVYWIQPIDETLTILPPGMSALPPPGGAVLSPALAREAERDADVRQRFGSWAVLTDAGVISAGERIAYVRPKTGASIAGHPSTLRVSRFGGEQSSTYWQLALHEPPPVAAVRLAAAGFLGLPAILVAGVAAATGSSVRESRLRLLARLGARRATLAQIAAAEGALLAIPGAIGGSILWFWTTREITSVPGLERDVFGSDLSIRPIATVAVVAAMTAAVALVTALTAPIHRDRTANSEAHPSAVRFAPVVAGLAVAAWGVLAGGYGGRLAFLAGVLIVALGSVLAGPALVAGSGRLLGKSGRLTIYLSGRRMAQDPVRWTRPFLATGVLAIIGFVTVAQIAISRQEDPSAMDSPGAVATVRWIAQDTDDASRFATGLAGAAVFPIRIEGRDVQIGASCAELQTYFEFNSCESNYPYRLEPQIQAMVAQGMGQRGATVTLLPPAGLSTSGSLLVVGHGPVEALHERVRIASIRWLTAPTVVSQVSFKSQESPLVRWLLAGLTFSGAILSLAAVVASVDRGLATTSTRGILARIGVPMRRVRNLEGAVFGFTYAVVVGGCALIGLVIASVMVQPTAVAVPFGDFARLSLGLCGLGVLAVLAFWSFHRFGTMAADQE